MVARGVQQVSRIAEDANAGWRGGGSFVAVLSVLLAGGFGALALLSSGAAEPLVLTIMALLATIGVFFLFGVAAGHIRFSDRSGEDQLLRQVVDAIGDGALVTTRDGREVWANRQAVTLLGRAEGGRLHSVQETFAGDPLAAEALFRLARAAEVGESHEEDVALRSVVGDQTSVRWFHLSVSPMAVSETQGRASAPTLWRLVETTRERSRTAAARSEAEARFALYAAAPIGILVAGADGMVEHANDRLLRMLRLAPQARARGIRLSDILPKEAIAQLQQSLGSVGVAAGPSEARHDLDLIGADGRLVPATVIALRRQAGPGGFIAGVLPRDPIDARGGDLRDSDLRLSRLFQSAPIGIATIGADGRIVASNTGFSRMLLTSGSCQGVDAAELLSAASEAGVRTAIAEAIASAVDGRAQVAPLEITVGDKKEFTRRLLLSPLGRAAGVREAAVLYVIDATEEKALELKYTQSQKMEAVGKLAGGIAHDFNNVLTAIIGFSDLLLQTHRPSDAAYKNIMAIKSSANRAAGMVSQLLAFSRRQTLQPEVLQLGEVLTDLSVLLNRLLGEKIDLKISQGRDLWFVKADRTQLGQVLINLSVNARDAMMPRGGALIVRTRNVTERDIQKLTSLGIVMGEYVLIEVEDTGSGMSPEVMAKIFEPFFTTKGVGKGTGLGLSTVYGIVKQTGGYIFADSTPGKGTTFRVYLPRHHVAADAVQAAANTAKPERPADLTGTGRVLLVEDEDAVRSFAIEALKRQGYEVLAACTGQEGLEIYQAQQGRIDLVVSDVIMPEMDGPSLYRELQKHKPDLKIIFMSGYPDDAFKNNLEPGAEFAFLQKPFSLAQLAAKVKEQLGR